MIFDFITIQAVFLLSWWLRFHYMSGVLGNLSFSDYSNWSLSYGVVAVLIGYMFSVYSSRRRKRKLYETGKLLQVHLITILMLAAYLYITKEMDISRLFLFMFFSFNVITIVIYRFIVKSFLHVARRKGYNKRFILIIGAGELGRSFHENLVHFPEMGYEVIGYLDDQLEHQDNQYIIGKVNDLEDVLQRTLIDEVVIALPLSAYERYSEIIAICEKAGVRALIIPPFHNLLPAKPSFDMFGDIPMINVRDVPLDEFKNRVLKRIFDIVVAIVAIVITTPLMLAVIIGIKTTSPGPIIFRQERVGMNRRTFVMYKFRTMRNMPAQISDTEWTTRDDPRTFFLGRVLRKTSIDELPQFFNVLKGDMSVVGPRPERPHFVEQFKEEIPKYMVKHHVRPGITGWAQSNGLRGDTSISDRIKYDIFYLENWTLFFDIKIIFKTITNGIMNKNAY